MPELVATPIISNAMATRWLSEARLASYLRHTQEDLSTALELYQWNTALASALARDMGHIEVLLRNAYDKVIQSKYGEWTSGQSPFHSLMQGYAATQNQQATENQKSLAQIRDARSGLDHPTHGHIVANLSLGYWVAFTKSCRSSTHWDGFLSTAFKAKGVSRGQVHRLAGSFAGIRNRCAHLEPVFSTTSNLGMRLRDITSLGKLLSPQVVDWIRHHSEVKEVLSRCPVPALCAGINANGYMA
jgi:hypothetical protein